MTLIELHKTALRFRLRNRSWLDVLRDLSLDIEEGKITAILGPSGCGKSSLLKLIGGVLRASIGVIITGQCSVLGCEPDFTRRRRKVGMLFQSSTLLPWLTVLENVLLPVTLAHKPSENDCVRAQRLLIDFGLKQFIDAYPKELSGGMAQRANFARVLMGAPAVMLLDEPFSALDEITRENMNLWLLDYCRRWLAEGVTVKQSRGIAFVTHSAREAAFLADNVVVLTNRPSHVREIFVSTLRRPKTADTLRTSEFNEFVYELRSALTEFN